MKGRIQPSYRLTSTFRKAVRTLFLDQCAICGWNDAPCDVAHIIARKDGGTDDIANVVMLCPNHHRMFDCGLIDTDRMHLARPSCLRHGDS